MILFVKLNLLFFRLFIIGLNKLVLKQFFINYTVKADCAGDFWIDFVPAQLLLSIDLNSWVGSKTSQKSPAQSAFTV